MEDGAWSDDDTLVDALLDGDADAFAWLLDTYTGPLRRLARRYVSTDASADEIVQEVWLAVITGLPRFERRSSFRTWLYRVLRNVARSRGVREQRSLPFSSAAEPDEGPVLDPDRFRGPGDPYPGHWAVPPRVWARDPADEPVRREAMAVIAATIDALPPNQAEVVTLRDVLGWSSTEVCEALDVTEGNQRVLLHRARTRIREALAPLVESNQ